MIKSLEFPQYDFRAPKSYTRGRKIGQPTVIIMHTTEGSEGRTSAEAGAVYDATRDDGTSTHFFVDQDSTIQCVYTFDEAHAARSHGNDVGIQVEVCGRAGQTSAQWADEASTGAIEQAAILCVAIREKYGKSRFPLVNLTPAQLRAGAHGFAEHLDATKAWPEDSGTHSDPGPNFPWTKLFNRIAELEDSMADVTLSVSERKAIAAEVAGKLFSDMRNETSGLAIWWSEQKAEILAAIGQVDEAVMDKLGDPGTPNEEVAATLDQLLTDVFGDRKAAIIALLHAE